MNSFKHHPIFSYFSPYEGPLEAGYDITFLGVKLRSWLWTGKPREDAQTDRIVKQTYPPFHEEYFEWIALLTAVMAAHNNFTMIELGAGWGRWILSAACALRQVKPDLPYYLIGVEAEPKHFEWMQMSLIDNNIPEENYKLIEAAVSNKDGEVFFQKGDSLTNYSHRVLETKLNPETLIMWISQFKNFLLHKKKCFKTRSISLNTILQDFDTIDLIDMDIQGHEVKVLEPAMAQIHDKVKMVHIETHSKKIDIRVNELFEHMGWENMYSYPCWKITETPYGPISFTGGVQTWVNSRYKNLSPFYSL